MLISNRVRRENGVHGREPSLLSGLLFDYKGNPLSPSYAVKNNKRYRYYVNQALLQFKAGRAGATKRIPAHEIESLVTTQFLNLLRDHTRLIVKLSLTKICNLFQKSVLDKASETVDGWENRQLFEKRGILRSVLNQVVLESGQVSLKFTVKGLMEQLGCDSGFPSGQEDTTIKIIAEAILTRVGGESRLIIEGGSPEPPANQPHPGLIEALVMANTWNKAFTNDPNFTIRAVAKQANLSERYDSGILKLAYLAPDITRAILRGAQPRSLSLKKLLDGIPLS